MKKISLFSAGGIVLAILLVLLATGAKSNTTLPESTVSETIVADTTAVTEVEKIPEAPESTTAETALAFSSLSPAPAPTAVNKYRHGPALLRITKKMNRATAKARLRPCFRFLSKV